LRSFPRGADKIDLSGINASASSYSSTAGFIAGMRRPAVFVALISPTNVSAPVPPVM